MGLSGLCGSDPAVPLHKSVKIRDIVLGMSASTDSCINDVTFKGMTYAPTASYALFCQSC